MATTLTHETRAALAAVTSANLQDMLARAQQVGRIEQALSLTGKFASYLELRNKDELDSLRDRKHALSVGGEYRYSL